MAFDLTGTWRILARGSIAAGGLIATAGVAGYLYATTPDVSTLRRSNPPATAFMELRCREATREGRPARRVQIWVPLDRISTNLIRAVLVAEDHRFWEHDGVNWDAVWRALKVNLRELQIARGGSTITQQLAKNLYLSPSRNPIRKLREVFIAWELEASLEKERILELYLNVIEWGDGIFGAEAAAREFFGKPAAELDVAEAALMAAAIMNPRGLDPRRPSPLLLHRQLRILAETTFFPDPGRDRYWRPLQSLRRAP